MGHCKCKGLQAFKQSPREIPALSRSLPEVPLRLRLSSRNERSPEHMRSWREFIRQLISVNSPQPQFVNPLTFLLPTGPVAVRRRQSGPSQPEPVLFLITVSAIPLSLFFRLESVIAIAISVKDHTRTTAHARFNAEHRRVPRFYYCTV